MVFNLTNIKTAKSRNGLSMSAKFWINDVHVADFFDTGDGGQPDLSVTNNPEATSLFAEFAKGVDSLPPVYIDSYDMDIKIDQYLFIDLLHSALVNKKEFKLLSA